MKQSKERGDYITPSTRIVDICPGGAVLTQSPEGNSIIDDARFWDEEQTWS